MIRASFGPLALGYEALVRVRNWMYDRGVLRTAHCGVPVVSVGNLTAGGTGKTPFVALVAGKLAELGAVPAVVSRGYGRRTRGLVLVADASGVRAGAVEGGDEPVELARDRPGLRVVVAERRIDAARMSVEALGADVVVMDDGFQHRALARDLDIVVVDARGDITAERMLPAGMLREPLGGLGRSHMIALSHAADGGTIDGCSQRLIPWFSGPVVAFDHAVHAVVDARSGERIEPAGRGAHRPFAFSAIGNNHGFLLTLRSLGMEVAGHCAFADHAWFGNAELAQVVRMAADSGATELVTTGKDAVRLDLDHDLLRAWRVLIVRVRAVITSGEEMLDAALRKLVERPRRSRC